MLLFGRNPKRFFPRARIRFVRYEGTEAKVGAEMNVIKDVVFEGRILQVTEKGWIVEAEVFGTGIDMWVRSQGDYIKDYKTIRSDRI